MSLAKRPKDRVGKRGLLPNDSWKCSSELAAATLKFTFSKCDAEIHLLEVRNWNRAEGSVIIVFMPTKSRAERQLLKRVQELLIVSGARVGVKQKGEREKGV